MALVKCKECGKKVSDKAEVCVDCGYPISRNKSISTVQNTKKSLKLQLLLSKIIAISMLILGYGWSQTNNPSGAEYMVLTAFIGFLWYLVTRVRIWWNHD